MTAFERSLTVSIGVKPVLAWGGKFKRRLAEVGTDRTQAQAGTDRTQAQVGTDREREPW